MGANNKMGRLEGDACNKGDTSRANVTWDDPQAAKFWWFFRLQFCFYWICRTFSLLSTFKSRRASRGYWTGRLPTNRPRCTLYNTNSWPRTQTLKHGLTTTKMGEGGFFLVFILQCCARAPRVAFVCGSVAMVLSPADGVYIGAAHSLTAGPWVWIGACGWWWRDCARLRVQLSILTGNDPPPFSAGKR